MLNDRTTHLVCIWNTSRSRHFGYALQFADRDKAVRQAQHPASQEIAIVVDRDSYLNAAEHYAKAYPARSHLHGDDDEQV